ncbi:hypothetical protein M885DRAFT_623507 [Pelagophyceae sp. CCMP2097]|nr:hypothetical protein M885DRAFT_623507 [Pelagophyceae sp. CCMP2097]
MALTCALALALFAGGARGDGSANESCSTSGVPLFPRLVGSKLLFENAQQVVWDLRLAPGERVPPHEHLYDYMFTVLEESTLAVFSGDDGSHLFSFDTVVGEAKAFERRGNMMHDVNGVLPPFPAVHGVQNVGAGVYREILAESKPCTGGVDAAPVSRVELHALRDAAGLDALPAAVVARARRDVGLLAGAVATGAVQAARGFSHATLATLHGAPGAAAGDALADVLAALPARAPALRFDYRPHAMFGEAAPLRRLLLVKFAVLAPVGALVAAAAAAARAAPRVQSFEWGPVADAGPLAQGFEYVFVLTFASVADRDAHVTHAAQTAFAAELQAHVEEFIVVEFVAA